MIDVRTLNRDEALKRIRIEKARLRFLDFVRYTNNEYTVDPVHEYVAARLQRFVEDCEAKKAPRLILKMPPQHGKSTLSSRHLPAWILGRNPKWKLALMSYSSEWATALSADARNILAGDEFQELWPQVQLDQTSTAKDEWKLAGKGEPGRMKAVGREGGITGRPAHVLIVDDPVKNRGEADSDTLREQIWRDFAPNFRTRMQQGGGILIVATQWHHDDLIGRLLELGKKNPKAAQFEVINLMAIAEEGDALGRPIGECLSPALHDLTDLEAIRADLQDDRDWESLYCGRPTPDEGSIFKATDFRYEEDDKPEGFVFMTADTAFSEKTSADYSVVATWRREQNAYRLLDLYRARVGFPKLKQDVRDLYIKATRRWDRPVALWVEQQASGQSLIQELQADSLIPVMAWKPDRSKEGRAHAVTYLFSSQRVIFPPNSGPNKPAWLNAYIAEMLQFPAGAHDDQVDVTTMALTLHAEVRQPTEKPKTHEFTWDDRGDDNEESQDLMDQLSGVPQLRAAFAEKRRREQEFAAALS